MSQSTEVEWVVVSKEVLPLLSKIRWSTLEGEAAWALAAQVFALSGPLPAALVADRDAATVMRRYVDEIWGAGPFGQKPAYYFSVSRQPGTVRSSSTPVEGRADALARFVSVLDTSLHETIHYLQMERCDIHRATSAVDLAKAQSLFSVDLLSEECFSDQTCASFRRTSWNTGLAIFPSTSGEYLTGSTGAGAPNWPTQVAVSDRMKAQLDEYLISEDQCRRTISDIADVYGLFRQNMYPATIDGNMREMQAHIIGGFFAREVMSLVEPLLKGLTRDWVRSSAKPGAFLVRISKVIELIREIPGAWETLRSEGTDKSLLMLANAFADTWRDSARGSEYSCGKLFFEASFDSLRDFVSTAGTLEEPGRFFGSYIEAPPYVVCRRAAACTVALSLVKPVRKFQVLDAPSGLKFNRRTLRLEGKARRRGIQHVNLSFEVNKELLRASIPVIIN